MASHCDGCVKVGDKQVGSVKGQIEHVHGLEAYVVGSSKDNAIVYNTDVFGHTLLNHQLAADRYAASGAGFTVFIPKIINEPIKDMSKFPEWLAANPVEEASKKSRDFTQAVRDAGFKSVQTIGVCYGARVAVDVLEAKLAKAAVLSHPTFMKKEDAAKLKALGVPLNFNCAERDSMFTPELRAEFEKELKGQATFTVYPNTDHGFTVRYEGEDGKKAAEQAQARSTEFFASHA